MTRHSSFRHVGMANQGLHTLAASPTGGGAFFLNDPVGRRVYRFDSTLTSTVVLDSVAGTFSSYGPSPGVLARFRGDSALFWPGSSVSLVVLDPTGKVARTIAAPPGTNLVTVLGHSDQLGLVYITRRSPSDRYPTSMAPAAGEPDKVFQYEDSLTILAMDLTSRRIDTLGAVFAGLVVTRTLKQPVSTSATKAALYPFTDEAVMTSDGNPAILRGRDLRVERITSVRGTPTSTRLTYAWERIDDALRTGILDSINTARTRTSDSTIAKWVADSAAGRIALTRTQTLIGPSGARVAKQVPVVRPAPTPGVNPSEIPDYFPATNGRSMRADADGRIWVALKIPGVRVQPGNVFHLYDGRGTEQGVVSVPGNVIGYAAGSVLALTFGGGKLTMARFPVGPASR